MPPREAVAHHRGDFQGPRPAWRVCIVGEGPWAYIPLNTASALKIPAVGAPCGRQMTKGLEQEYKARGVQLGLYTEKGRAMG